ncbi:hypothetical protein ABZ468_25710 [Streptomyces sp. NPDC005708]|uniref:hypothetical protein n=1 Tax=Streptomyces sp. NPDC005708 TaxID=3154564 RepID=UPI0033C6F37E
MTTVAPAEYAAPARQRDRVSRELLRITGRMAVEVRITRTRWPDGLHWVAMVLVIDPRAPWGRREVPLTEGGQHREIALLLRGAFPNADWARAQDYDVVTGTLREHLVRLPACLRDAS